MKLIEMEWEGSQISVNVKYVLKKTILTLLHTEGRVMTLHD